MTYCQSGSCWMLHQPGQTADPGRVSKPDGARTSWRDGEVVVRAGDACAVETRQAPLIFDD
jgi:hypothetical protein